MSKKQIWVLSSLIGSLLLSGCSLAPQYQPERVVIPLQYKEIASVSENENWKIAQPSDAASKRITL